MKNPLLGYSDQPFGTIPFKKLKKDHFIPAVKQGIKNAESSIEKITQNADLPTFGRAEIKFQLSYISISPHTIESSVISISVSPLTGSGIPSF